MKGTSLVVSIVLFVAVAVLYVLHFSGANEEKAAVVNSEADGNSAGLRIAYIKADSVLLNYDLSQVLHEEFTKKQEAYTNEYGAKRQSFEKDAAAFQEKLQRGGFLTEQRAIQERDRLMGMEQEIVKMDQDLSSKLAEIQGQNNKQLLDQLMSYLEELNAERKYDYIFNASNILIGREGDNITAEVLKALNERHAATEK